MRLSLIFLFAPVFAFAQSTTFQKRYDFGHSETGYVHVLPDSSYAIFGGISHFPGERQFLVKADQSGNVQWAKAYSIGSSLQGGTYCNGIPLRNGGYLLNESIGTGGFTFSNRTTQTDASGNVVYTQFQKFRPANSEVFADQMQTSDGYIVSVATSNMGPSMISSGISVYKCDTLGNLLWNIVIETDTTTSKESPFDILECSDGNYLMSGRSVNPNNGSMDCFVVKISTSGSVVWKNLYGTAGYEMATSAGELSDGSLIFCGLTTNSSSFVPMIFKTDVNGNLLWTKKYTTTFPGVQFGQLLVKSDGEIIIYAQGGSAQTSPVLMSMDTSGNVQWCRYYNLSESATRFNAELTPDNGFILACSIRDLQSGEDDIVLIKTDSIGKSNCLGTVFNASPTSLTFLQSPSGWVLSGGMTNVDSSSVTSYTSVIELLCPIDDAIHEPLTDPELWFQNPASNTVALHSDHEIICVEFYSATGQLSKSIPGIIGKEPLVPVPEVNGMYVLVVHYDNGVIARRKIIVGI